MQLASLELNTNEKEQQSIYAFSTTVSIIRKLIKDVGGLVNEAEFKLEHLTPEKRFTLDELECEFNKFAKQYNIENSLQTFLSIDIENITCTLTRNAHKLFTHLFNIFYNQEMQDSLFPFDDDVLCVGAEGFDEAIIHVENRYKQDDLAGEYGDSNRPYGPNIEFKKTIISLMKDGRAEFKIEGDLYETMTLTTFDMVEMKADDLYGHGSDRYIETMSLLEQSNNFTSANTLFPDEPINALLFKSSTSQRTPIFHPKAVHSNSKNSEKELLVALESLANAFQEEAMSTVNNQWNYTNKSLSLPLTEDDFSDDFRKLNALRSSQRKRVGIGAFILSDSIDAFKSPKFNLELKERLASQKIQPQYIHL